MRPQDLPSPGFVSNGVVLKTEAYKAISAARIQADLTKGESRTGFDLRAFFLWCAAACPQPVKPAEGKETK